jgi:hypothetical protein
VYRATPRDQAGSAVMVALLFMATSFVLIVSGLTLVQMSKTTITRQLVYHGQAVNAAHAGLAESLSWFRRQTTQPVATFSPQLDGSQTPPLNETDDPSIGLVRDFEVSKLGSVRGRYEVRFDGVTDATDQRGKEGNGTVWEVESVGIVYVRNDPAKDYDELPNRVLSTVAARSELQRMSLVLPANAAIHAPDPDWVTVEDATRVHGGSAGIGVVTAAVSGTADLSGEVFGIMQISTVDPYLDSIADVFGVTQRDLLAMADLVATSASELPDSMPDMWLTVINGNAVFDPSKPLVGTGILVVFGNLLIQPGSLSSFNGLIYTTGNFEMNSPSQVSGSIVSRGTVRIRSSGDFSEVYYDPSILAQIQRHIGQYRSSRSPVLIADAS